MVRLSLVLLFFCAGQVASASIITFDLLGDSTFYSVLDDQPSGSVTNGGIGVTLTASDGELNRAGSGFGINGAVSGDDTDALNIGEYVDLYFDQAVRFARVNISSWNSGVDEAELFLHEDGVFVAQGSIQGTGDTAYDFTVTAGQVVRLSAVNTDGIGNGFSFDSFSVEAIPEPAVISFVALIGIGALTVKRWVKE